MKSIKEDLEGEIKKKTFDEFLKIEKPIIEKRLSLLGIILGSYSSIGAYNELKNTNEEINKEINKLIDIKDNIILYHRETYKDKIKALIELIKDNQNKKINEYKSGKIKDFIGELEELLSVTIDQVKRVKNNLLFNVIYENMNLGKNETEHFENAVKKLDSFGIELKKDSGITEIYNVKEYKNIFDIIKEKLSTNEKRAQEFIDNLKEYFRIENKDLINDLTILFKIKKYEMDINSIIFFFEFFQKDNPNWNQKLDKKKFENLFSKKENLKENEQESGQENPKENDFEKIKQYLKELKENKIYNYDNIQNYNKLFTCLYDKKEAIDFLFSKIDKNIAYLYDRIQPTDRTISIADIKNTEDCISVFSKMKKQEDNFIIHTYIKNMKEKEISKFENFSRIYSSIIELDIFYDDSENLYDEVKDKIKDKTFNIFQDENDFNLEDLIHIKNKIHIKNENTDKKQEGNSEENQLRLKCDILKSFKNLISNLEVINSFIKVLRSKGSSLPIKISIKTKIINDKLSIEYYLDGKINNFEFIRDFLFKAKNNYISQLNSLYKQKYNLSFFLRKTI